MNRLIFNSYPRSGNVYLSHLCASVLGIEIAAVHIPEIYGTKNLFQVGIFRNPKDAIASLLYKQASSGENILESQDKFSRSINAQIAEYLTYIELATNSIDSLHICKFDDLSSDPLQEVLNIKNKFDIDFINGFNADNINIHSIINNKDRLWTDKHDGHLPREKDALRIKMEEKVLEYHLLSDAISGYNSLMKMI